jgi:hypothetical protein
MLVAHYPLSLFEGIIDLPDLKDSILVKCLPTAPNPSRLTTFLSLALKSNNTSAVSFTASSSKFASNI